MDDRKSYVSDPITVNDGYYDLFFTKKIFLSLI